MGFAGLMRHWGALCPSKSEQTHRETYRECSVKQTVRNCEIYRESGTGNQTNRIYLQNKE